MKDVDEIVVVVRNGFPIKLKDIADIEISSRFRSSRVMFVDESGTEQDILLMFVRKRSGASIVATSDRVKKELNEIAKRLPADIKVLVLLADQIRKTINDLGIQFFTPFYLFSL